MKSKIYLHIILLLIFCTACTPTMDKVYADDSKIISQSDTYGIDVNELEADGDKYSGRIKISGSYSIWKYECDEDTDINISYLFSVASGKAKLVLITPDNTIHVIASGGQKIENDDKKQTTLSLKKGTNRLKLVGKNKADIKLELDISEGTYLK